MVCNIRDKNVASVIGELERIDSVAPGADRIEKPVNCALYDCGSLLSIAVDTATLKTETIRTKD